MNADWMTYRHPLGLSFRHPAGWSLQQSPDAIQFVPEDNDADSELIVASFLAAPVPRIDDPSVIDYMDSSISQAHPGLRRTADPAPAKCPAGDGIVLRYAGQLGDGRPGAAVVHSVLVDGTAISLVAFAIDARMAQRQATLAEIFATFAIGDQGAGTGGRQAQVDPNLVGTWRQSRARHDSDGLGGGTFDSSSTTYFLAPDGTYVARHKSQIIIDLPGGGGGGGNSETESAGTWSANGEFLVVRSQEGGIVVSGTYKAFNNGIEIYPTGGGGGGLLLLERVR
jgi:hypothetical protein